jgi:hypothetical protein
MSFPRYPEYKDSGVEWLGEVPAHWSVEPFKRQIDRETLKIDALVAEQRRLIELLKEKRTQAMHRPDFKHDRRAIGMNHLNTTCALSQFAAKMTLDFLNVEADNLANKTRQGYARKRTLKLAGYFFVASDQ